MAAFSQVIHGAAMEQSDADLGTQVRTILSNYVRYAHRRLRLTAKPSLWRYRLAPQMVNSNLQHIPASELILELQARGIDMSSAIEQMQVERRERTASESKVIQFNPKG